MIHSYRFNRRAASDARDKAQRLKELRGALKLAQDDLELVAYFLACVFCSKAANNDSSESLMDIAAQTDFKRGKRRVSEIKAEIKELECSHAKPQ